MGHLAGSKSQLGTQHPHALAHRGSFSLRPASPHHHHPGAGADAEGDPAQQSVSMRIQKEVGACVSRLPGAFVRRVMLSFQAMHSLCCTQVQALLWRGGTQGSQTERHRPALARDAVEQEAQRTGAHAEGGAE